MTKSFEEKKSLKIPNSPADRPVIPHSRPSMGAEEIQRVSEVIASGHVAQGRTVRQFEARFADCVGIPQAVAVSSGTAALHLALAALEVGAGHEVIIPSYVCTALMHAVRYVGAQPVLADVDPETFNIDAEDVARRLTARTRAIVVPHMFGLAARLDRLLEMKIPIIEDCAQAVGTRYRGQCVGTLGHAAIFSFYATKVITTGEGGMVVSASPRYLERVIDLRAYDGKADAELRFNYKMTDVHAALGLAQIERLDGLIQRRRDIAARFRGAFSDVGCRLPTDDPGHIYYRYVIGLDRPVTPVIERLRREGIGAARPVFKPLHRYLKRTGYAATERVWEQSLSLPIYPSLSETEIDRIVGSTRRILQEK